MDKRNSDQYGQIQQEKLPSLLNIDLRTLPLKPIYNKYYQDNIRFHFGFPYKKYRIRYMRAPHMFFFSVKVFEKVSKLENSPFYRNGLQY